MFLQIFSDINENLLFLSLTEVTSSFLSYHPSQIQKVATTMAKLDIRYRKALWLTSYAFIKKGEKHGIPKARENES
jgi:hypothetical protein